MKTHGESDVEAAAIPADALSALSATLHNFEQHSTKARPDLTREILKAIPAAIYTTDADGYLTYYNERAAELWGYRPEVGKQRWCGTFKIFLMDGTPVPHDQCPMATAVRSGKPVYGIEAIGERPDGKRVPCAVFPTPMFDEAGNVIGGVNMLVDITERKAIEEHQSILVKEMDHRIKNNLATIQAIMGSTIRASTTMEQFQEAFLGRIRALAKTNSLLTQRPHQSVALRQLLENELEMYRDGDGARIACVGPDVTVPSNLVVPLGMAIHELTTNAVKYGGLSALGATLSVTWEQTVEGLTIRWRERNVPSIKTPHEKGFGTQLLTGVLPVQTGAKVDMRFETDGLSAVIFLPMSQPDQNSP